MCVCDSLFVRRYRENERTDSNHFSIDRWDLNSLRTDQILKMIGRVVFQLLEIQVFEISFFIKQYPENVSTDSDDFFFFLVCR